MNRRGFTLIELATVAAITGIIAALSLSAYGRLKDRARLGAFHANLVADMQSARNRAMLDQRPVVVVLLNSSTNAAPDRYVMFEDGDSNFALASFAPPIAAPDVLLDDQSTVGTVSFGPSTGWGAAFPEPFAGVPSNTICTFGQSGFTAPYDRRAAVVFNPDGTLGLSNGALSGSLSIFDTKQPSRISGIALIAPSGSVKGFTR